MKTGFAMAAGVVALLSAGSADASAPPGIRLPNPAASMGVRVLHRASTSRGVRLSNPALAPLGVQVAATVRVTVHASRVEGGAALPSATVSARDAGIAATTDSRGIAVVRGLSPGRHTLVVSAVGFADVVIEVEAFNGRVTRARVALDPAPIRIAGLDVRVAARGRTLSAIVIETAELPAGVADLPAAIGRIPGATVVRRGGPGASATLQLRGAGDDQVLVLLDGTPINSPLTGVADLSTVDLESVSRIVVIPGAQSARYGPQALGGVVLLESSRPNDARLDVVGGLGAWSAAETAVNGSRGVGDAWSVSGGARWRRSEGAFTYDVPAFRGGGETTRQNAAFSRAGGDLRIARRGRANASLRAHLGEIERGTPGTIAQPSLTARQNHRRYGVDVGIDWDGLPFGLPHSSRSRFEGSARASIQWQRARYADPAPPFGPVYDTRTRVRRAGFALEGGWTGTPTSLRFGLSAARLDVESNVLATPAVGSNALATPTVSLNQAGAWANAGRGFALGRGVGLKVGANVRADRHDLVDGTAISPSFDATLARADLALHLRWGRGFAAPGLGDLFFQEGVLVEPNPDLGPERVRGDVAATLAQRWSLGAASGEVRATAYRADIDDMILWFPDHRFVWSPDNYDVARRGFEVGATADLAAFGHTHGATVGGAWSRVEYADGALDGQIAYRPRFTADAAVRIGLPRGMTLSPSASHIGERRTVPGSALNGLAAYTLFDFAVSTPFEVAGREGRFDLTFANLFDKRAALLVDYPLPGRGWSTRVRLALDNTEYNEYALQPR